MGGGVGVWVPVNKGRFFALVDADDYDRVAGYSWTVKRGKHSVLYAKTTWRINYQLVSVYMHQMLVLYGRGFEADHINGDGLDNRKENLRICLAGRNKQNRVGRLRHKYKGYHFDKLNKCWRVQISVNDKTVHVGLFDDELDAARAYDEAASKYYGEYARLNFPQGGPQ